MAVGGALFGAQFADGAVGIDHDGRDDRLAAQPLCGGDRQRGAVGQFAQRVVVAAVAQRLMVDVDGDLGDPPPGSVGRHGTDDGLDLELGERQLGVGRVLAKPGELGLDGGVERRVAERVERQQGHLHARRLVGPTLHRGLGPLPVEFGCFGLGRVLRRDAGDAVFRGPLEL